MDTCHDNHEKSSTTKINGHEASGYTINMFAFYRGKNCMERFCNDLKDYRIKIINYEKKKKKKEMIPLKSEEKKLRSKQKVCYKYKRKI